MDFEKEYHKLSNVELLKIVQQPQQYQAEAITTAQNILKTRIVTPDEYQEVSDYTKELANKEHYKKHAKILTNNTISEQLQSIINPFKNKDGKPKPIIWVRLIVLVITIYYLFEIPNYINLLIDLYKDLGNATIKEILFIILPIIYPPITCLLLLKKRKSGWIAIMLLAIFIILSSIYFGYKFLFVWTFVNVSISVMLINLFIYSFLMVFLLRKEVLKHFNINKDTVLYTIATSITFCGFIIYFA